MNREELEKKLKMIGVPEYIYNLTGQGKKDEQLHIYVEDENYINFFSGSSDAQENYIRIKKANNYYWVEEIHRDDIKSVFDSANIDQAKIVASIVAVRLYSERKRDEKLTEIREMAIDGRYDEIEKIIKATFTDISFKIHEENDEGLALLKQVTGLYLLKFKGKEILNGMSIARGFAVLYNYCKNVEFAKKWYMDNKEIIGTKITLDEVEKLFLFGQIIE